MKDYLFSIPFLRSYIVYVPSNKICCLASAFRRETMSLFSRVASVQPLHTVDVVPVHPVVAVSVPVRVHHGAAHVRVVQTERVPDFVRANLIEFLVIPRSTPFVDVDTTMCWEVGECPSIGVSATGIFIVDSQMASTADFPEREWNVLRPLSEGVMDGFLQV